MLKDNRAEALAEQLLAEGMDGKRVLLARAEEAREVLPETLAKAGADVQVVSAYRTVPPPGIDADVRAALDRAVDLPPDAEEPVVTEIIIGEVSPAVMLALVDSGGVGETAPAF